MKGLGKVKWRWRIGGEGRGGRLGIMWVGGWGEVWGSVGREVE